MIRSPLHNPAFIAPGVFAARNLNCAFRFVFSIVLISVFCFLSSSAQAACANPTGAAGNIMYNNGSHIYQYCNGTSWISMTPSPVSCTAPGSGVTFIVNNASDSFVIVNGQLWGTGFNGDSELGQGNTTEYTTYTQVGTLTNWTAAAVGWTNENCSTGSSCEWGCGIAGGALYCSGDNSKGELGLGNTTSKTTMTQVGTLTNWTAVAARATARIPAPSIRLASFIAGDTTLRVRTDSVTQPRKRRRRGSAP